MIEGLLWVEKYRPQTLEALALSRENRRLLEGYIAAGEIPHLLLAGPSGIGKTSLARIFLEEIECETLMLNASNERGIDVIRNKVALFARSLLGPGWNIVLLDEADYMTPDAQAALRNTMEQHASQTRFILTCNYIHKITDAIQSRCQIIELQQLEVVDRYRVLVGILEAEEIEYLPPDVLTYAERFRDLRRMVQAVQKAVLSNEERSLPPASDFFTSGAELWQILEQDDWPGLVTVVKQAGFDYQTSLRDLFWAVPDKHKKRASLKGAFAKAFSESPLVPDPCVHMLGACSEAMAALHE